MKGPGSRKCVAEDADMESLYAAMLSMRDAEEMRRFLTDLCTPAELTAFAERWKVARLLAEGVSSYREINSMTGVSVTTIGRVARFLNQEPHQGYALALKRVKS